MIYLLVSELRLIHFFHVLFKDLYDSFDNNELKPVHSHDIFRQASLQQIEQYLCNPWQEEEMTAALSSTALKVRVILRSTYQGL